MTRSKVKSRSQDDVVHLQPLSNVPTKYQLPTPYGFWGKYILGQSRSHHDNGVGLTKQKNVHQSNNFPIVYI